MIARSLKILFFFILFCKINLQAAFLIRDAETEEYIRLMLNDILKVADIPPRSINLYIIKDDNINAFVSGGANIFVNTGLLQSSSSYKPVQMVLAHEVGHVKGAHIVNFSTNVNSALTEALFYSISGALLALGGGSSAAVITALSMGSNVANRRLLSYTRAQEREADYYASQILQKLGEDAEGAIEIFSKFQLLQEKFVDSSKVDEYLTTHPFPPDRLDYFKNNFATKEKSTINAELLQNHYFVSAKLAGYFGNMQNIYPNDFIKNEDARKYFEGFTYFRNKDYQRAIIDFKKLSKKYPTNAFFYEAIAEAMVQQGSFLEAIEYYKKSLNLKPNNFNFLYQLAEVYFLIKDYENAIKYMEGALTIEPFNPQVPFRLAYFYNATSQNTIAKFYFLNSEVLRENYQKSKNLLSQLKADIKKDGPMANHYMARLKDIELILQGK